MLLLLSAVLFVSVSSNAESCFEELNSDVCEVQTLGPPLGSSVLLPCNFARSNLSRVLWTHGPEEDLVQLTSGGQIEFLDHRYGRLKVFPNQGSEGNFSIVISELQTSDLGCYRCRQDQRCVQVELLAERACHAGAVSGEGRLLVYCAAAAALILLSIGGGCCIKCLCCFNDTTQEDTANPEGADTVGVIVPEEQREPGNDNLVYENDDQDPSNKQEVACSGYCSLTSEVQPAGRIGPDLKQSERMERTKQRVHRELFNRLRQASLGRHYYVNQGEISKQQAEAPQAGGRGRGLRKKKAKDNVEYRNPIYNRSTDQLNHL